MAAVGGGDGGGTRETRTWTDYIREEISAYRLNAQGQEDVPPLEFWKTSCGIMPKIGSGARIVLTTPVTSVPRERVFSLFGLVSDRRRSSLSPELTETNLRVG